MNQISYLCTRSHSTTNRVESPMGYRDALEQKSRLICEMERETQPGSSARKQLLTRISGLWKKIENSPFRLTLIGEVERKETRLRLAHSRE